MDNPLIEPNLGLVVWQTIILLLLIFILAKFAWKPILKAVKEREESIEGKLQAAEKAKEEMASLHAQNEELLNQARAERDLMLKEARETKEKMIAEAKSKASEEADRLLADARESIRHEKMAAITELKNQVAALSIEIAEKIVREDLASDEKQKQLATTLIDEMNLN